MNKIYKEIQQLTKRQSAISTKLLEKGISKEEEQLMLAELATLNAQLLCAQLRSNLARSNRERLISFWIMMGFALVLFGMAFLGMFLEGVN